MKTALAFAVASIAVNAPAPGIAASAGRAPEFGTDITVVSLPVFVTDDQAKAVAGLAVAFQAVSVQ